MPTQAEFKKNIDRLEGLAKQNKQYAREMRRAGNPEFAAVYSEEAKKYEEEAKAVSKKARDEALLKPDGGRRKTRKTKKGKKAGKTRKH